jgi:hypothetical protein
MDVVAPDPNQVDGYLVVLKPGIAFARWRAEAERGASPEDVAAYLSQPRTAIPAIDRSRYRGIRREAIDRWWEGEPPGNACRPDEKARRRIWELYGPDPCLHWTQPPWFDAELADDARDRARRSLAF